jgi:hypothetical protein
LQTRTCGRTQMPRHWSSVKTPVDAMTRRNHLSMVSPRRPVLYGRAPPGSVSPWARADRSPRMPRSVINDLPRRHSGLRLVPGRPWGRGRCAGRPGYPPSIGKAGAGGARRPNPPAVRRDANGRLLSGASLNPGGRPVFRGYQLLVEVRSRADPAELDATTGSTRLRVGHR